MAPRYHRKRFPWKIAAYAVGGLLALTLVLGICFQGTIRGYFRQSKISELENQLQHLVETISQLEDKVTSEIERGEVIYTHELRRNIELYKSEEETLRGQIEALKN